MGSHRASQRLSAHMGHQAALFPSVLVACQNFLLPLHIFSPLSGVFFGLKFWPTYGAYGPGGAVFNLATPPSHAVFPDFFFLAAHGRCGNPAAEYHHPPHDEVFPNSWFWGHMGGARVPLGNVYTPLPHAMHGFQQFSTHPTTARQCFQRGSSTPGLPKRVCTPCNNCPHHPPHEAVFSDFLVLGPHGRCRGLARECLHATSACHAWFPTICQPSHDRKTVFLQGFKQVRSSKTGAHPLQ